MPGSPLADALHIRSGAVLWFSPIEWLRILGPLPPGVTITSEFAAATVAVVFVSNVASVRWFFTRYGTVASIPPFVWMCYPTRGRADFNRTTLLATVGGHGLHPVTEVAIDATWAALRLRPLGRG